MSDDEILKRLDELAGLKPGDPIPHWMMLPSNDWGTRLSELAKAAAELIRTQENLLRYSDC